MSGPRHPQIVDGVLLYRCRLCNDLFPNETRDDQLGRPARTTETLADNVYHPHGPRRMFQLHTCSDGAVGVADLVGGRPAPKPSTR